MMPRNEFKPSETKRVNRCERLQTSPCVFSGTQERWKHISAGIRRINRCCTVSAPTFPSVTPSLHTQQHQVPGSEEVALCWLKTSTLHTLTTSHLHTCPHPAGCRDPLSSCLIFELFNLSIGSGWIKVPGRGWGWQDAAVCSVNEKLRQAEEQIHLLWSSFHDR